MNEETTPTAKVYTEAIARAWLRGDYEESQRLKEEARARGRRLQMRMITRAIDALRDEPEYRLWRAEQAAKGTYPALVATLRTLSALADDAALEMREFAPDGDLSGLAEDYERGYRSALKWATELLQGEATRYHDEARAALALLATLPTPGQFAARLDELRAEVLPTLFADFLVTLTL